MKILVSHVFLDGLLLLGACGKVGSQLDSEGMSWSLRSQVRAQDQVVSLGGGEVEGEGQQLSLVCFTSCVLPICPPHCHLKCGRPRPRPGALGWWLLGQGKEEISQRLCSKAWWPLCLSPLVAVVSDISRFLSVFQEPHVGVIQAARQLLSDEKAPLRQKLLADLLGTVSENITAETRAEDPPWFEGTSWILAWREWAQRASLGPTL